MSAWLRSRSLLVEGSRSNRLRPGRELGSSHVAGFDNPLHFARAGALPLLSDASLFDDGGLHFEPKQWRDSEYLVNPHRVVVGAHSRPSRAVRLVIGLMHHLVEEHVACVRASEDVAE